MFFCLYEFGYFFVRYVFSPNMAMSSCKPFTYRSIVFLKSWICRTGSDSMSVSSRDSIWGSVLTSAYCFCSTWCWTITSILWVHPNLVGDMKYGSICGQIWVPNHDSQFAPLRAEIPLLETVGGCPNPVLSKDLNNPSQSKNKIRNETKKTSATGKTHNGQKNIVHTVFQVYIYICMYVAGNQECSFNDHQGISLAEASRLACEWTASVPAELLRCREDGGDAALLGDVFVTWVVKENFFRKPLICPLNTKLLNIGVSCKFSLKPIHWICHQGEFAMNGNLPSGNSTEPAIENYLNI